LSTGRFVSTSATNTVLRLTNVCNTLTATTAVLEKKKKMWETKEQGKRRSKKKKALFIYMNILMTYNTTVPRT